jgi:multidrug efflux pump subunit AcrA (membrane-fusion protein)
MIQTQPRTASPDDPRQFVTRMAREIELLADAGGPPETFFQEFLQRLVSVLAAEAGAVWLRDPQGRMGLACEIKLAATGIFEKQDAQRANERVVGDVGETGEARVLAPDVDKDLPSAHVLLMASLNRQKQVVGVVQIFQRPDSPRDARPGYLQFMEQMCGHASRYLSRQETSKTQGTPIEFWKQFERFLLQIQRSLYSQQVAHVAANDARNLLQCDRVSLAVRRGDRTRILAISGADAVNRRANLVRLMARLSHKVTATGEELLFTGSNETLAPQVELALTDYIQESGSRMVQVIPLRENAALIGPQEEDEQKTAKDKKPRKVIGALIVEQSTESRPRPNLVERANLVAEHVGGALDNALKHERLFLLPVWRFLGDQWDRMRGKRLRRVLAGVLLVAAVTAALVLVQWDYRAEGKGRLMPKIRRDVFASWDGEVVDLLVDSSQRVNKGDPLLKLRNEELNAKLLAAVNDLNEKQQLLFALEAQANEAVKNANKQQEIETTGKMVQTRVDIGGIEEQVRVLKEQVEMLTVRAPADGVVATFQLQQLLMNRPVQRGEKLMEVMDDTQDWVLELEIPEHRMGHVLRRQRELDRQDLPVEFLLATTSETTFNGKLEASSTRSVVSEEEGTVVEAFADIDPAEMPRLKEHLRIGAEVRAKVNCGRKTLGYVLFGDVIEWVLRRWMLW